jgi:hypothetical protein
MKFAIFISTMNGMLKKGVDHFSERVIVINQCSNPGDDASSFRNFAEAGLSLSRNRVIETAARESIDIALIADNDVTFIDGIEERIVGAFCDYPEADIITFQALTPEGGLLKDGYKSQIHWHDSRSVAKVSSIEIAFNVDSVVRSGIRFDERFGLGAAFPTGEEFIFLTDALRKGLKILYVPAPIVIHPKTTSGGRYAENPWLIQSKGAMIYRVFGAIAYFVCVLFAMRHYKEANISILKCYGLMLSGIRSYKTLYRSDRRVSTNRKLPGQGGSS